MATKGKRSRSSARPRRRAAAGRDGDAARTPSKTPSKMPADGKLYYRIGEVSRITGVKPYVLRYWESEFRWMAPQKSRSNQRLYRQRDIDTILLIKKLLYEQRFTIAGARKKLRELGRLGSEAERAVALDDDPRVHLRRIKHELQAVRALL